MTVGADVDVDMLANRLTQLDETVGEQARADRYAGLDWPDTAETMVGIPRLHNIVECLRTAEADGVPGGFAECGVWRGGACIMAAAVLAGTGRPVWVCDSFQGLPAPDPRFMFDQGSQAHTVDVLKVPRADVEANFARYGLLTEQVRFVEGWFADSLPGPIGDLCVLRLDGDMYGSTWDSLAALYGHVQPGGFVIVDDYGVGGALLPCKQAVDTFREIHDIAAPLWPIEDGCGAVFWQIPKGSS